jgi:hypothetical protein
VQRVVRVPAKPRTHATLGPDDSAGRDVSTHAPSPAA